MQSIANLARELKGIYDIYIICTDTDSGDVEPLHNVQSDKWVDFEQGVAKVFYISKNNLKSGFITKLIQEINPDYIFVNGVYSFLFSITPLLAHTKAKKIMSVRGMLHPGALSQKALKKKVFLLFFKISGLHKSIMFHVTDTNEEKYVKSAFGENTKIFVAENFPKRIALAGNVEKKQNELTMVSIALISPMKNHLLVIQALKNVKSQIVYDIYGPVIDQSYWALCESATKSLPANITVTYKGELEPIHLAETLPAYNAFILPNFSSR